MEVREKEKPAGAHKGHQKPPSVPAPLVSVMWLSSWGSRCPRMEPPVHLAQDTEELKEENEKELEEPWAAGQQGEPPSGGPLPAPAAPGPTPTFSEQKRLLLHFCRPTFAPMSLVVHPDLEPPWRGNAGECSSFSIGLTRYRLINAEKPQKGQG